MWPAGRPRPRLLPSPTWESGRADAEPPARQPPAHSAAPGAGRTWGCERRPQPTPETVTATAARSASPSLPAVPSSTGPGSAHAPPARAGARTSGPGPTRRGATHRGRARLGGQIPSARAPAPGVSSSGPPPPAEPVIALAPGACVVGDPAAPGPAPPPSLSLSPARLAALAARRPVGHRGGAEEDPGLRRRLPLPGDAGMCTAVGDGGEPGPSWRPLPGAPVTGKPGGGGARPRRVRPAGERHVRSRPLWLPPWAPGAPRRRRSFLPGGGSGGRRGVPLYPKTEIALQEPGKTYFLPRRPRSRSWETGFEKTEWTSKDTALTPLPGQQVLGRFSLAGMPGEMGPKPLAGGRQEEVHRRAFGVFHLAFNPSPHPSFASGTCFLIPSGPPGSLLHKRLLVFETWL